jgi:Tol biopolymer transport system component/predicted Ser/Thr protein kinase
LLTPLAPGTRLGPFEILGVLGAGGMGVVYRAVDIDLKRPVALKLLNAAALGDPDRKRRFVQEAQAASALNHPDIVTIYQIGTDGATDFIAMEFVAGRSLDQVLSGRRLPLADVVKFAARIAGALAAAHHAGIVHRDLKPANVMVTDKGGIKLLDFGVAKLLEPTTAESALTGPMAANTMTGLVIGTAAYMSPEQARGERIDARSDIYSFGIVLHEMITGKRPVDGAAAWPASTPRDLRRIVARCLQTDPDRRFQVMDDVALALEDVDLADPAAPGASHSALRPWHFALATLLVAAAAAGTAWWLKPPPVRVPVLTRLTVDAGLTTDPALSPDGRFLAFASDRGGDGTLDIWVRQVAGGDPFRLTKDPADDVEPSFSPDGSKVVFRSERDGGGIYVVSTLGGDERRIADQGRRPRWSPDGSRIVYWTGLSTAFLVTKADAPRVFVVPAGGGEAQRLFSDFAVASSPIWSPDGKRLLFWGQREMTGRPDWWIATSDGTTPVATGIYALLIASPLGPPDGLFTPDVWTSDGRVLLSARQGDVTNIWGIRIGEDGRLATGGRLSVDDFVKVTRGTAIEAGATVDTAGTLAFAALSSDVDLWSLPIDPATGAAAGPQQRLTQDPASDFYPDLSPDGLSLVFGSNRSGAYGVWLRDLVTGKDALVVARYGFPSLPTFTKDGLRIIFHAPDGRGRWLSIPRASAGTRSATPLLVCDSCESFWDLSTDGTWAVFGTDGDTRILARNIVSGATSEIMRHPDQIMGRFRISPDDRWMAFNNRERGSIRIYVMPFQPGGTVTRDRWIPFTPEDEIVNAATWSADGGTLYYLSNRDGGFCVWGQRLDCATGHPAGDPFAVWHFHEARRSISRLAFGTRALAASRDRLVTSAAEGAGNIWLAR